MSSEIQATRVEMNNNLRKGIIRRLFPILSEMGDH